MRAVCPARILAEERIFNIATFALENGAVRTLFELDDVTVGSLVVATTAHIVRHFFLSLQLTHQESIDVVPGQPRIEWRGNLLTRGCRPDEMWRDDNHEVRFVLLIPCTSKYRTHNIYGANPAKLRNI